MHVDISWTCKSVRYPSNLECHPTVVIVLFSFQGLFKRLEARRLRRLVSTGNAEYHH